MKNQHLIMALLVVAGLFFVAPQLQHAGAAVATNSGGNVNPAGSTCGLATTSTITSTSYDADKIGTAVGSETKAYYLDTATGQLNPGSNTVQPGQTITVLTTKASWFGTKNTATIPCAPSILMTAKQKAVDTAITMTGYDTDGISALGAGAGTGNNMSIGASGSATAHVLLQQSAAYKHLSGETNKFAVFVNATNMSDWAPAQMSVIFDGQVCTAYASAGLSNAATPAAIPGTIVYAAVCNGDFAANDGSLHRLDVKVAAASGINPGAQNAYVSIGGVDYYADTTTGAVGMGVVKDSGAAIQTLQSVVVPID